MSLEDQIGRLANAIAMQENTAVAEIIRQRDAAVKQAQRDSSDAQFCRERLESMFKQLEAERRKSAALRGVITKLKAKQPNLGESA